MKALSEEQKEILEEYRNEVISRKTAQELAAAQSRFMAKFDQTERSASYYFKLQDIKNLVMNLADSIFAPVFLRMLAKRVARSFDSELVRNMKYPEYFLTMHFAKNHEEYIAMKRFFLLLRRSESKRTKFGILDGALFTLFAISCFVAPISISLGLFLSFLYLFFRERLVILGVLW